MNYRHAYHAGGFADVFKHAVLTRILVHLLAKPAAFRVIDTHAGAGLYDLAGPQALRTNEWRTGIGRLLGTALAPEVEALLAPYLEAVRACNVSGELRIYPGSPALVRHFLRAQDRLIACELDPTAAATLATVLRGDRRLKALTIDGWMALPAYVPPRERRGIVLVDPPFEAQEEFERLALGLEAAHRKWPTGIYLSWYPIKERDGPDALARRLRRTGIPRLLRAEFVMAASDEPTGRLGACGLFLLNPPWRLADELATLLPALVDALSAGSGGTSRIDWLAHEKSRL